MIKVRNIQAMLADNLKNNVFNLSDTVVPTNGTSGTGAGTAGPGSLYTDVTNKKLYVNTGTKASPTWSLIGGTGVSASLKFTATLSPALIAANTSAEQLFTVTGVAVGDVVQVNKPTAQAGLAIAGVRVSAANQVGITFGNHTAGGITPTAGEVYAFSVVR